MHKVVAIDGPSGAGKSTMAKRLAEELGFRYLDTGALYRAVALGLINEGLTESSSDNEIVRALERMRLEMHHGVVYVNGKDVSVEIRATQMGHYSSVFSARRPVREYLMPVQKAAAEDDDIVAEGRDMTTVIFPDAWRKFYLDATVEARAKRRFDQLQGTPNAVDMAQAERDVVERDERDSSRDIAPLRRAEDAIYIDSSSMDKEEVVRLMRDHVSKA